VNDLDLNTVPGASSEMYTLSTSVRNEGDPAPWTLFKIGLNCFRNHNTPSNAVLDACCINSWNFHGVASDGRNTRT
jgi:hypothetical protein